MKRPFFIYLFLTLLHPVYAADANDLFQQASEAYQQKEYQIAIGLYEDLLTEGVASADIYFNLGTSYLQAGQLGKSRLYLEKAMLLDPYSKDIRNNLSILKDKIETTVIPLEDFFLKRWWIGLSNLLSPQSWMLISVVFGALIILFLYGVWFKNININPRYGLITLSSLLFLTITLGFTRYQRIASPGTAIVMQHTALKSSASEGSETLKQLSPGVKLKIREEFNEWLKVSTLDLEEGWLTYQSIEKI